MEAVIGIFLYVAVVAALMAFGKFLKKCDERIVNMNAERKIAE